jgi:hypothetical protein
MEMTGNLWEMIVHSANNAGLTFTGRHGNGELNASGDADVDYWPGIGGNNNPSVPSSAYTGTGVTGSGGTGLRGGCFFSLVQDLRVSARAYAAAYPMPGSHNVLDGFRAVRTAPAD